MKYCTAWLLVCLALCIVKVNAKSAFYYRYNADDYSVGSNKVDELSLCHVCFGWVQRESIVIDHRNTYSQIDSLQSRDGTTLLDLKLVCTYLVV